MTASLAPFGDALSRIVDAHVLSVKTQVSKYRRNSVGGAAVDLGDQEIECAQVRHGEPLQSLGAVFFAQIDLQTG